MTNRPSRALGRRRLDKDKLRNMLFPEHGRLHLLQRGHRPESVFPVCQQPRGMAARNAWPRPDLISPVTMTRLKSAAADNRFGHLIGADSQSTLLRQHPNIIYNADLLAMIGPVSIIPTVTPGHILDRLAENSVSLSPTRQRKAIPISPLRFSTQLHIRV